MTPRLRLRSPLGFFRHPASWYPWVCGGMGILALALQPISYIDADVWIHLSGGQYLWTHHTLQANSYFSFLQPPRPWISYTWLFQGLFYGLYRWAGYAGLIGLRVVLYGATLALISRFLIGRQERHPAGRLGLALIVAVYAAVLLPRFFMTRPHMFTYFFIAAFLSVLELRPQRALGLPLLAILWCNVHGVAYPLLLLLCGAYSAEYFVRRWQGAPYDRAIEHRVAGPTILAMGGVYLTPLGSRLLEAPFRPLGYLSQSVSELVPLRLQNLFEVHVTSLTPTFLTLVNVLLAVGILCLLVAWSQRTLRVSHAILFGGALLLLPLGWRFSYEATLLLLPLIRSHVPSLMKQLGQGMTPGVRRTVSAGLLAMPAAFLLHFVHDPRGTYPVSYTGLPQGVCTVLRELNVGGRVLNIPTTGGYLRWQLYPRYTLFMDMDSFFTDEDFYVGQHAFLEREVLQKVLDRYDPAFISASISLPDFRALIAQVPDYSLIFFDDAEALYVNRRHYPTLAQRYAIRTLDPFKLMTEDAEHVLAGSPDPSALMAELRQLLELYPDGGSTNNLAATQFLREGAYDRALLHARRIIRRFPESAHGYLLAGDALAGLRSDPAAIAAYRQALRRVDAGLRAHIFKRLGRLYRREGRYPEAYRAFTKGIDVFSAETNFEELFLFGEAAAQTGHPREAQAAWTFLSFKLPPGDTQWRPQVEAALKSLGTSP